MVSAYFNQRLKDLDDNLKQEAIRLKDYEDGLRDKSSQELKQIYRQYIEERRYYIAQYQQEYQELQKQLNNSALLQTSNTKNQFQQIDEKLNILIIKQDSIANDLATTRETLLNRYDVTERVVVESIAEQLNQFQLSLTQELLYAIETNRVSERQIVEMLAEVEKNIPALPPSNAEKLANIIRDPAIDSKHKLKVSLPIVPLLLGYEATIELGGGLNLKSVWEQSLAKIRRNPKALPGKPIGNYTELRKLLEAEKFKEADIETARIMLEIAGRTKQDWLRTQDIKKFPVADLKVIDNLWYNLSKQRFGFKIQREIWLSINPQLSNEFDGNLFSELGEKLGWHRNNRWLKYEQFDFNLNAPEGHLPSFPLAQGEYKSDRDAMRSNFQDLLSRLQSC